MSVFKDQGVPYRALDLTMAASTIAPASCPNHSNCAHYYDNFTTMAANVTMGVSHGNVSNETMDYACYFMGESRDVVLSHRFVTYSSLVFVLIGLVGNFFSILVFTSREMRVLSSNVYLLMLALSDTLYLLSVFFRKTLSGFRCLYFQNTGFVDLYHRSNVGCRLLQYLLDLFADYSICLILAFTIERFMAVYHPIIYVDKFTVQTSCIVCFLLFALIAISILPYHVMYMVVYPEHKMCLIDVSKEDTFWACYIAEAVTFHVLPVIIIAVLNGKIIIRILHIFRSRHADAATNNDVLITNGGRQKERDGQDKSLQLTVMLILVSTAYVITYIPMLVHFILTKLSRSNVIQVSSTAMAMAQNYTGALYICGFAMNFFLYTLSGDVFRKKLQSILGTTSLGRKHVDESTSCTEVIPLKTVAP